MTYSFYSVAFDQVANVEEVWRANCSNTEIQFFSGVTIILSYRNIKLSVKQLFEENFLNGQFWFHGDDRVWLMLF